MRSHGLDAEIRSLDDRGKVDIHLPPPRLRFIAHTSIIAHNSKVALYNMFWFRLVKKTNANHQAETQIQMVKNEADAVFIER